MYHDQKAVLLASAILIALTLGPARGASPAPEEPKSWGIVHIAAPNEANLLHLVGIQGRGHALVRMPGDTLCRSFEVRLVAGGFWGRRVGMRDGGDIRLVLNGPALLRRFARGSEVISDEHLVSDDPADQNAEILIAGGLPLEAGFVIRPGGSPLAEFFGPRVRRVSCARALRAFNLRERLMVFGR